MINHYGKVHILREDKENWLRSVAVCPSCGKEALYGSLMMYNGGPNVPMVPRAKAERNRTGQKKRLRPIRREGEQRSV